MQSSTPFLRADPFSPVYMLWLHPVVDRYFATVGELLFSDF